MGNDAEARALPPVVVEAAAARWEREVRSLDDPARLEPLVSAGVRAAAEVRETARRHLEAWLDALCGAAA